jgi:hypothetical protein
MSSWLIEPLPTWQWRSTTVRKPNPFRSPFDKTLKLLTDEAGHLETEGSITIMVVADGADVRRDGMLRAKAVVRHAGVAVRMRTKWGLLTYPCDAFYGRWLGEVDWQINLRAIALGLEALRKLDRYGISGQQYTGWLAIESGRNGGQDDALSTVAGAERFLRNLADETVRDAPIRTVWREVSKRTHPDLTGGERGMWEAVQRAGQTLNLTVGMPR